MSNPMETWEGKCIYVNMGSRYEQDYIHYFQVLEHFGYPLNFGPSESQATLCFWLGIEGDCENV